MNVTLVLVKFWGIILVVLCVSILVNVKFYVRLAKSLQDEPVRFLYFFVVLAIGAVCVAAHNEWAPNIRGLITLLGWGSLLKGILGILFPESCYKIIEKMSLKSSLLYLIAVVFLVIGGLLLFVGFVH